MTPRHALQAAAKQFGNDGNDGTDRSLSDLMDRVASYLALGNRAPFVGRDESTPALSYGSGDAVVHPIPDESRAEQFFNDLSPGVEPEKNWIGFGNYPAEASP